MDRPHPIQVATLILAGLATIFAFVAMRVAFDARNAAESAAHRSFSDASGDVHRLQDALIRTGVIEDPWLIPDDFGEAGGPWARCLTVPERIAMGRTGGSAPLPDPPCDTIEVEEPVCEAQEPDPTGTMDEDAVEPEPCAVELLVDGAPYRLYHEARPDDVDADGSAFFNARGVPSIDRYVQGRGDLDYAHLVGFHGLHGWYAIHPGNW